MINIGERIKNARKDKKMTRKKMASILGVTDKTIFNYENNISSVTLDFLLKMSELIDIDYDYLVSKTPKEDHQTHLQSNFTPPHNTNLNEENIQIPVLNENQARYLTLNKELVQNFNLISLNDLSIFLRVGDSMTPTIPEGSNLLIQNSKNQEGRICVVSIDDELYIRRFQKLPKPKLLSDNNFYEDIELNDKEYKILGVVVGFVNLKTIQ